jgi:hypothetical protein
MKKRLIIGILLLVNYASSGWAQSCLLPPDREAFTVIALKSALMVGALSCGHSEQYDDFMTKFQSFIENEQHVLDAYFVRAGGLANETDEDSFITSLANSQSVASIAEGPDFCAGNADLFDLLLSLKDRAALESFISDNTPAPPAGFTLCAPTRDAPPPAASPPAQMLTPATPDVIVAGAAERARAAHDLVRAEPLRPPQGVEASEPRKPTAKMMHVAHAGSHVKKVVPKLNPAFEVQFI